MLESESRVILNTQLHHPRDSLTHHLILDHHIP
jgi:hypothetical protein